MDHMEEALSARRTAAFDGLGLEEQLVMYKDMEIDVQNYKGEVDRVIALGKHLIEEIKSGKLICFLYLFGIVCKSHNIIR